MRVSEAASSSCNPSADMLPSSGVTLRPGLAICSHHKQACIRLHGSYGVSQSKAGVAVED